MARGELEQIGGSQFNAAGQNLLDEILTNPGTVRMQVTTGRFAGGVRYISPSGTGATFDQTGQFQYFGSYPP
jgi:hypothetical protein